MDDLIPIIERSWSWTGIAPKMVLERNAFGHLLVLDQSGQFWRICPEKLACAVVSKTDAEFSALRASGTFREDWEMVRLREIAQSCVGQIAQDRAYHFKIPTVLGGAYDAHNIGDVSLAEQISFSGDLAFQIKDLPGGATVNLQIIE